MARVAYSFILAATLLHSTAGIAQAPAKTGTTPKEYVDRLGGELVPAGQLVLDGRRMTCGRQPTVLDSNLNDYSAAYPRFTILNPRRLAGVTTTVKLFLYNVACGFQLRGPDPAVADCFAIERGVKDGWLAPRGLNEVCAFFRPTGAHFQGHLPGPQRCEGMRTCYKKAASRKP